MNEKIKFIRNILNLSCREVSRFLNISSYFYSFYEKDNTDIPFEILYLLSIIYELDINSFIESNITIKDIKLQLREKGFLNLSKKDLIKRLENNLSVNDKLTYKSIKRIIDDMENSIIENIISSYSKNVISNILELNFEEIDLLLNKKRLIKTNEVVKISNYFNLSIEDLTNKQGVNTP